MSTIILKISFASTWAFYLLPIPVLMIIWSLWKRNKNFASLGFSNLSTFKMTVGMREIFKSLEPYIKPIYFTLLILALARPQTKSVNERIKTEGISIMLAMDVSTSMLAKDFKPNRLESAKKVASDFINKRLGDRIGLVFFAGEAFTQCPVTIDHDVLLEQLMKANTSFLEDGTAIGMGLATSINRMITHNSKSKVIILLTDGVNNMGFVDPYTAADAAREYKIKVYTIGVGTNGRALTPVGMNPITNDLIYDYADVQIDEKLLKYTSDITGGKYFRADNNKALEQIFSDIDKLEKSEMESIRYEKFDEKYRMFLIPALLLFALEQLFTFLFLKSLV